MSVIKWEKWEKSSSETSLKEEEGKLRYELDWEFVELIAKRMSLNKGKYEPYNWKNPIAVERLLQAQSRHFIEVMKGNYSDEQEYGHLVALACNAMMIIYQLKTHHK
jgi:hypothetical protein